MRLPNSLPPSRAAASLLVLVGTVYALAWAAGVRSGPVEPAPGPSTRPGAAAPAARSSADAVPVYRSAVRVWIHRDGVHPTVVRAEPGPAALHAENETGGDVTLVLERVIPGQATQRAARVTTTRRGKRARQELELGAGEYLFYEESRSQLKGRLIVERSAR